MGAKTTGHPVFGVLDRDGYRGKRKTIRVIPRLLCLSTVKGELSTGQGVRATVARHKTGDLALSVGIVKPLPDREDVPSQVVIFFNLVADFFVTI